MCADSPRTRRNRLTHVVSTVWTMCVAVDIEEQRGLPFAIFDSGYVSRRWQYMSRTTWFCETSRFAVHVWETYRAQEG